MFFALNHLLHFYRGRCRSTLPAAARRVPALEVRNGTMLAGAQPADRADRARSWRPPARRGLAAVGGKRRAHAAARRHDLDRSARPRPRRVPASLRDGRGRAGRRARRRASTVAGDAYGVIGCVHREPGRARARATIARLAPRRVSGVRRGVAAVSVPAAGDRRGGQGARAAQTVRERRRPTCRGRRSIGAGVRAGPCRQARGMTHGSRSPASAWSRRSARRARRSWRRHARRRLRHPAGDACSTPTAIAAASPPKSPMDADRRRARRRSSGGAGRAAIASACTRRPKRSPMPGCSTAASIGRGSACSSAPAPPICCATRVLPHLDHRGTRAGRGRRTCGIIFPSTPVDVIAERFGFEGPRGCVVAACSSSTIAIGRGVDAIRHGPRRRGARRRHRCAVAADVQRLQPAAADGSGAVPAVRSQPRRDEHRRRRRDPGARGSRARARAAARRIYAELAGHGLACEAFHPTAPEPEGRPVAAVISAGAATTPGSTPTRSITSTRTAPPRRRTTPPKRAGSGACSATAAARIPVTSIKSMIGHCLGAAGAVEAAALALTDRARRDPADDPPRRDRRRLRGRRRRQRGARAARALRRVDVARLRRQRLGARDARGLSRGRPDELRTRTRLAMPCRRSGAMSSAAASPAAGRRRNAASAGMPFGRHRLPASARTLRAARSSPPAARAAPSSSISGSPRLPAAAAGSRRRRRSAPGVA